jgi:hypothetical protein
MPHPCNPSTGEVKQEIKIKASLGSIGRPISKIKKQKQNLP